MSTQLLISTSCWTDNIDAVPECDNDQRNALSRKALAKKAEEELRETENVRTECLRQLKVWIQQNQDVENCITDDNFLLRFLRVKKFSIPMAQQTLLKYLNFRKRFDHIFRNLTLNDDKVNELLTNGYIFVSPVRDSQGRRVILYDLSKFDPKRYTGTDMARAHAITYETLLTEEENQILGVVHVADIGAINASFVTLFTVTEFGTLIKWGEQSFPMRHKEIHLINMPQALRYVYDFARSNITQKLKERISVHDGKSTASQSIELEALPAEFGGHVPAKDMITWWTRQVDAKAKRILATDDIRLLSDAGIIRSKTARRDAENMIGSFRKLEVD
ncbi:hypothetical protein GWI33_012365 [Rhynchophorus ferrugineus]|uniref:CRAL-TRIO domain-containing protein n=1 Tax=Rhynchophorus ferrugineus TaxID=354439 RepID=A0A834I6P1_RHYFE|nr:hypothetical protein GWI33_012365 [Rhynchophorus ferrugineus]